MNNQVNAPSPTPGGQSSARENDWLSFLLLAFVGLPVAMTMAIATYGFVVWFLQILFFGPPS